MAVDERTRHELHTRAAEVLGAEHAETLMSMLPPVGWADVATRRDLDAFQAAIQQDMALLRSEVRHDMAALKTELKGDIQGLRTEFKGLEAKFGEFRGDLHQTIAAHQRNLFFGLSGVIFTVATLAWAAISLT